MHVNSPCPIAKHNLALCCLVNHGFLSKAHLMLWWVQGYSDFVPLHSLISYSPFFVPSLLNFFFLSCTSFLVLLVFISFTLLLFPLLSSLLVDILLQVEPEQYTRIYKSIQFSQSLIVYVCPWALLCCLHGPVTISVLCKQLRTIHSGRKQQAEIQPWVKCLYFHPQAFSVNYHLSYCMIYKPYDLLFSWKCTVCH